MIVPLKIGFLRLTILNVLDLEIVCLITPALALSYRLVRIAR